MSSTWTKAPSSRLNYARVRSAAKEWPLNTSQLASRFNASAVAVSFTRTGLSSRVRVDGLRYTLHYMSATWQKLEQSPTGTMRSRTGSPARARQRPAPDPRVRRKAHLALPRGGGELPQRWSSMSRLLCRSFALLSVSLPASSSCYLGPAHMHGLGQMPDAAGSAAELAQDAGHSCARGSQLGDPCPLPGASLRRHRQPTAVSGRAGLLQDQAPIRRIARRPIPR